MKRLEESAAFRTLRLIVACLLAVAFFLLTIRFGLPPDGESLDASWLTVNAWAFANNIQIGSEQAFTYGPWGIVHPLTGWTEASYSSFLIAMPTFAALTALLVGWSSSRLPPVALLLAAITVAMLGSDLLGDGGWLIAMIMCLALVSSMVGNESGKTVAIAPPKASTDTLAICLLAVFLAWLSQVKFSLFMATPMIVVGGVLALSLAGRRTLAAILALLYPCAFVVLWLVADQNLSGIPLYVRNGLDTSIQYGAAMGTSMGWPIDVAGLALLFTIGVMLLIRVASEFRQPGQLILTVLVGGVVYLGWRAGFTRADQGHVIFFVAAACGGAVYLAKRPGWLAGIAVVVLVPTALALHFTVIGSTPAQEIRTSLSQASRNITHLRDPGQAGWSHRSYLERWQSLGLFNEAKTLMGKACVDILGVQQGLAINAGMNYCPRPVFQTYATYSEHLTRLNEAFFADHHRAPEFLLVDLQPIDGRLGSSEDPLTLAAALRAYHPVEFENGFLIMHRHAADIDPVPSPAPAAWHETPLGEWIDIPAHPTNLTLAHLRVEPNLPGLIHNLVLREPALFIELDAGAATIRFRVPRPALTAGFIVNPLIHQTQDILGLYLGTPGQKIGKLRVVFGKETDKLWFQGHAAIAFTTLDVSESLQAFQDSSSTISPYPGFSQMPSSLDSPAIRPIVVDGTPALLVHAPARLEFVLPASQHELRLRSGIQAEIASRPECRDANGVTLRLEIDGETVATAAIPVNLENAVLPTASELEATWSRDHPHSLRVYIDDNDDSRCDWSYISELSITDVASPQSRRD